MMSVIVAMIAFAAQGSPVEWIGQAHVPGFSVAHRDEGANGMIIERIPNGETVERWTRMVTVQRFTGAAERLSPHDLLSNMSNGVANGCPGSRSSEIVRLTISGRPAARFRVDCPLNPSTGLPETFTALAIAGASDLHVAQVAFRRVPSRADDVWADRQIGTVVLCRAESRDSVCSAH